jgi:DUF1009 family protein
MPQVLGLIAGDGEFPIEIARAARHDGRRVHAIAFHALTGPALCDEVDEMDWLHLGEVGSILQNFRRGGVRDVVMAGKVDKRHLYRPLEDLRADGPALELLAGMRNRHDASILSALADWLESKGLVLHAQTALVPELAAKPGCLGRMSPNGEQLRDLVFGWPIAKATAALDIGQCIVVEQQSVLAVEAVEGTDAAVARGCALGGAGASVLKVAKQGQDPRFDLPTIGPGTLIGMAEAGAGMLAFEACATVLLRRDELVAMADKEGIVLLGVDDDVLGCATSGSLQGSRAASGSGGTG